MSIDAVSETIGTRLARVASRFPERIALVEGSSTLSFRELDEAATRIAQMILTAQSGGSSRHVCLLFQSRLLALKAIFGAARSGYAYVPLDAGDPEERLRSIIVDSEAAVLLTEHGLLHRASAVASTGGAVIDIAHMPSANVAPLPDVSPDVPMNIYYTSGSTGRPKGAIQTHRNLLFFADTYARCPCCTH
jgi:non-ribosomal peptide synthetase component F